MAAATALAAATLCGCASDTDKVGERLARQELASQVLVVAVTSETCDYARRVALREAGGQSSAEERCKAAADARQELVRLEKMYLAACGKCAAAERCSAELRRVEDGGGRAERGGACP